MNKKLKILLGIMLVLIVIVYTIIGMSRKNNEIDITKGNDRINIVTTFYPVYMIGQNLASGIEEIEINSLTDLNTGCLHDYQLTTADMKLISVADVLVVNGGGMESFLGDIKANYPELLIIDASEGIEMLPGSDEHALEAEEEKDASTLDEHDHGEWNAHVWLDPQLYNKQIEQVADKLQSFMQTTKEFDSSVIAKWSSNKKEYIDKVKALDIQITELSKEFRNKTDVNREAVIFHDAFAYLANRIGITVAHTVLLDSDTSLSAGEIGEIIDEVQAGNIQYLFTEAQFSDSIATRIASETDISAYVIDSAVTGDGSKDSYLSSMQKNIDTLKMLVN